jgi:hypothetical protein
MATVLEELRLEFRGLSDEDPDYEDVGLGDDDSDDDGGNKRGEEKDEEDEMIDSIGEEEISG